MKIAFFALFCFSLSANPFKDFSNEPKIAVQNAILAQVNGKTISMIDVKKKMDMVFHQSYPQLEGSNQARLQFYESSWRHVLMDLIDHELMIADAENKEIKITDGEIREAMEERFGPNVMQTLDRIGLTYEESWQMVKNEMIVQRMSWWFIQSKAVSKVSPSDIREAYRLYLDENPPYAEWKYQVISIRTEGNQEALAKEIYETLSQSGKSPQEMEERLKNFETPEIGISLSNQYTAKSQDLSEVHRLSLEGLSPGKYSKPSLQIRRAGQKTVYRIFYLADQTNHPAPLFEDLSQSLRNQLIQKAIVQESESYLGKLRKYYGFESDQTIPEDLHPFSLQ